MILHLKHQFIIHLAVLVERPYPSVHISMIEEWHTIAMAIANVQHSMRGTSIMPTRPFLEQVTNVDDERVSNGRYMDPGICWRV